MKVLMMQKKQALLKKFKKINYRHENNNNI